MFCHVYASCTALHLRVLNACRLYVRDKVIYRSQVMENNHHPRWNEDFKFLIHEPQYQVSRDQFLVIFSPSEQPHLGALSQVRDCSLHLQTPIYPS